MMVLPAGLGMVGPAAGGSGGGAPVYLSGTAWGSSASGNSHNVPMPVTVNAGDLLLVYFGGVMTATDTYTPPSTWTKDDQTVSGSTGMGGSLNHKIAAGTEGGTSPAWTQNGPARHAVAVVIQIQAGTFDPTIPFEFSTSTTITGSNRFIDPEILNPSWGSADILAIAIAGQRTSAAVNSGFVAMPYASGQVQANNGLGGTANSVIGSCYESVIASSINPGNFDRGSAITSGTAVAYTIAVQPV